MGYVDMTAEELSEILDDLTVPEIEQLIAEAPDNEREAFKASLRAAEQARENPRQGVLDATDPTPGPAEPPPGGATHPDDTGAPTEDTSGPELIEVAQQRAANAIERRLAGDEEE